MSLVTNSVLFMHNQTNGYVFAPQYQGTTWPNGPLGGRSGLIPLTTDYVISFTITNGGSGYVSPTITVGTPWSSGKAFPQGSQCVNAGHVYTATNSATSGATAPTCTSGTCSDGAVTWQYAGTAAVITATPNAGAIQSGYVTLISGGSGYATTPPVVITDSSGTGATMTVTLNGFPQGGLVPGVAYLDTYTVVGQSNGRLYCSFVNDPSSWNALAYVTSYSEPNALVGISKHLNYVAAFSQWSTNFFYDSGTSTQLTSSNTVSAVVTSPLSPVNTYGFEIGCANGQSIAQLEQSIVWVGQSKDTGPAVYMLEGLSPVKVSSAYIERILETSNLTAMTSYVFKFNGHTFYVLTLGDLNVTIVYDIGEKTWYNWTYYTMGDSSSGVSGLYAEQYFRASYYSGSYGQSSGSNIGTNYFFLDDDNGIIYTIDEANYNDAGAPIYFRVVTPLIDSGSTKRKFHRSLEIVGDKVPANMKIRHSDDDYNTWSSYRSVTLNQERPIIHQLGQSRRRAYEFLCTDNQPLRFESAELNYDIGEMQGQGGS